MSERTCAFCGAPFVAPKRTSIQRFCSISCGQKGITRPPKSCATCGALFVPLGNKAKHCDGCAPRRQAGGSGNVRHRIRCEWCCQHKLVTKRSARFCSHRCYRHWEAWNSRPVHGPLRPASVVPLTRWPQKLDRGRIESSGRTFYSGPCRRCGEQFTIIDQAASSYCSLKCQRADGKDRRRALKRGAAGGELVYRKRIFERDRWICQLCGQRVKRSAVAPHPKSPTIDHIVPLAEGGKHEPANVQCAHFICNALKGVGVAGAGEQLRLIG